MARRRDSRAAKRWNVIREGQAGAVRAGPANLHVAQTWARLCGVLGEAQPSEDVGAKPP